MKSPLVHTARTLRRTSTDAERRLWYRLRGGRLGGAKFRRQHPVGRYVADFACTECRLIIELDGSQHMDREAERDVERTACLRAEGYRVLRFWNNEVFEDLDAVLERIHQALPLTPGPSPRKRGEGSKA